MSGRFGADSDLGLWPFDFLLISGPNVMAHYEVLPTVKTTLDGAIHVQKIIRTHSQYHMFTTGKEFLNPFQEINQRD